MALASLSVLMDMGFVTTAQVEGAKDIATVLEWAIKSLVACESGSDLFGVRMQIHNRIGHMYSQNSQHTEECMFFSWETTDVGYIPLDTVGRWIGHNRQRNRLLASLAGMISAAAEPLMKVYSYEDAIQEYNYEQEMMAEEEESGFILEAADPQKDPAVYFKDFTKLQIIDSRLPKAVAGIDNTDCRKLFEMAIEAQNLARELGLPESPLRFGKYLDDQLYSCDGRPCVGLGIAGNREDAITSWLDQYMNQLYEAGCESPPAILIALDVACPQDLVTFFQQLPKMVRLNRILSQCVNSIVEYENVSGR